MIISIKSNTTTIFYADLLDLILQAALKRYKLVPANGS